MKIDSNISYTQHYKSKHGSIYDLSNDKSMRMGTGKNNNVNRGYNSGSTVSFGAAANFSNKVLKNMIDGCNNHTVIIQNLVALLLAIGPRPLAIMLLPDKKRKNTKDKVAAATHGIASGLVGFSFASAIMYPLGVAAKKVKKGDAVLIAKKFADLAGVDLKTKIVTKDELIKGSKIMGKKFLDLFGDFDGERLVKINKDLNFDRATKALDMSLDTFILGVAKAMLTIRLIPPIMKYLFGVEKTDKKAQSQATQEKVQTPAVDKSKSAEAGRRAA